MIPLPVILAELVMALGAALVIGSVVALVRPRVGSDGTTERPVARGRVLANIGIGLLVFAWALASFLHHLRSS